MGFFDTLGDIFNPKNLATAGGFLVGGPLGAAAGRAIGGATFGDNWEPGRQEGEGPVTFGSVLGDAAVGGGSALVGQQVGSLIGGGGGGAAAGEIAEEGAKGGIKLAAPEVASAGAGSVSPSLQAAGSEFMTAGLETGAGAAAGGGAGAAVSPAVETAGTSMMAGGAGAGGGGAAEAGLSTMDKLLLGGQGVQAAGNIYGSYQQGKARERQHELQERQMALAEQRREEEERRRRRQERLANLLAPYFQQLVGQYERELKGNSAAPAV